MTWQKKGDVVYTLFVPSYFAIRVGSKALNMSLDSCLYSSWSDRQRKVHIQSGLVWLWLLSLRNDRGFRSIPSKEGEGEKGRSGSQSQGRCRKIFPTVLWWCKTSLSSGTTTIFYFVLPFLLFSPVFLGSLKLLCACLKIWSYRASHLLSLPFTLLKACVPVCVCILHNTKNTGENCNIVQWWNIVLLHEHTCSLVTCQLPLGLLPLFMYVARSPCVCSAFPALEHSEWVGAREKVKEGWLTWCPLTMFFPSRFAASKETSKGKTWLQFWT